MLLLEQVQANLSTPAEKCCIIGLQGRVRYNPQSHIVDEFMPRSVEKIPKLRARGRENRRKLLREAQRLMHDQPRDALKFSDVFEAAGISRGSAYRIYNGIEDLFQDIATEWVNNFVDYLRKGEPDRQPEHWTELSDFVVRCGADYWSATADTLRLLPRLRVNAPSSYRLAVQSMSQCLVEIFDRYFVMPEIEHWSHKLGFLTELCDITFADAVRTEGRITEQRLTEAEILGRTYLAFYLPARLPRRKLAS